jgi:hypothetical protein
MGSLRTSHSISKADEFLAMAVKSAKVSVIEDSPRLGSLSHRGTSFKMEEKHEI